MDRYKLRNRLALFIIFISFFSSFAGIFSLNFLGPDEPRYSEIGFNMAKSGDYLLPILNGRVWLEKPPLLYWFIASGYKIFGESEFSARFFPALIAFISPIFLFIILYKVFHTLKLSLYSSIVFSLSPVFVIFSKGVSCDFLFSVFLFFSILFLYVFFEKNPEKISLLFFSSFFLALSILSKGILALILFFIFFYVLSLLEEKFLIFNRYFLGVVFTSILFSFPWFYLVFRKVGYYFIFVFFINHNLARFFTPLHQHVRPFYYFVPVFFIGFAPYSLFIFKTGEIFKCKGSYGKFLRVLFFSFLSFFVFFSLSGSKLPGYLLPAIFLNTIPAAFILIRVEKNNSLKRIFSSILFYFFLIVDIFSLYFFLYLPEKNVFFIFSLLLVSTVFAFSFFSRLIVKIIFKMFILLFVFFLFLAPILNRNFSTKGIISEIPVTYYKNCRIYLYRTYNMSCGYYTSHRCVQNVVDLKKIKNRVNSCGRVFVILKTKRVLNLLNSFLEFKTRFKIYGRFTLIEVRK